MNNDLTISIVPYHMIDLIWDKVEPLIQVIEDKAPEDVVCSVVKNNLKAATQMLVVIYRNTDVIAVHVLDIKHMDSGIKILYIPITSGSEMELWLSDFLEVAKTIAKSYGCVELRGMSVRKGWMTKLKPYGWEEMFTTIRCKIGDES